MNNEKRKYLALVTGGTRGIGEAICKEFLKKDIEVIITGTSKNSNHPKGSTYKEVNFLSDTSLDDFISYVAKQKVDILINNAGINRIDYFTEIKPKDFDEVYRVNLKAPFLLSQAVVPNMLSNNWGRIINISSIFGKISKEKRASYSASKFGLDGLTAAMSAELCKNNILVNSVGPGFIDTDMTRNILGNSGISKVEQQIPIRRLGNVEEIASFVCWLASDSNTYLTGQNIMIDGGFTRV